MSGTFLTPGRPAGVLAGVLRPVLLPAPAPGVEIVVALGGAGWYRLVGGRFNYVASAVVGARNVRMQLTDGSVAQFDSPSGNTVAASGNVTYSVLPVAALLSSSVVPVVAVIPWPDILIPPGFKLQTSTAGLDVGDQYGASQWLFEELVNGPYGAPYGPVSYDQAATEESR